MWLKVQKRSLRGYGLQQPSGSSGFFRSWGRDPGAGAFNTPLGSFRCGKRKQPPDRAANRRGRAKHAHRYGFGRGGRGYQTIYPTNLFKESARISTLESQLLRCPRNAPSARPTTPPERVKRHADSGSHGPMPMRQPRRFATAPARVTNLGTSHRPRGAPRGVVRLMVWRPGGQARPAIG